MTKIYEALENADRQHQATKTTPRVPTDATLRSHLPRSLEEKLLSLFQRIDTATDAPGGKVASFVGVQAGDESSNLACEFAKLAAMRLPKKVLLLGAFPVPYPNRVFAGAGNQGFEGVIEGSQTLDDIVSTAQDSRLSIGMISMSETSLPTVLASPEFGMVMKSLRERYDLTVIDAPPFAASSDALLLAPVTDGVVVVIEANRTRWQIARNCIEQLEAQGGTVLGTILNRQRHYIPGFIYNRL